MMKKFLAWIMISVIFAMSGGISTFAAGSKYAAKFFMTKSVSAGFYNAAAIKNDGTVWAWGFNEKDAFGSGSNDNSNIPVKIEGIADARSVDIDMYNTVVLAEDGSVYVIGDGNFGQRAGDTSSSAAVKIKGLDNVADIQTSCYYIEENGELHAEPYIMALDDMGNVYAWGANKRGMLGTGSDADYLDEPTKIESLSYIESISVNGSRAAAIDLDGNVYCWGYNGTDYYYADKDNEEFVTVPTQVEGLSDVVSVSVGSHVLALDKYGKVYGFGNGDYKQLCGRASTNFPVEITEVSDLDIREVFADNGYSVFLSDDGSLYGSGNNCHLFSDVAYDNYTYPVSISAPDDIKRLVSGSSILMAQTRSGEVYAWGLEGDFGAFGAGEAVVLSDTPVQTDITQLMTKGEYAYSRNGDNILKIEDAYIYDNEGDIADSIESSFTGSVSFRTVSGKPDGAMVALAVFENSANNRRLAAIDTSSVTFDGSFKTEFDIEIKGFDSTKDYSVCLFVWDITSSLLEPYFKKSFDF